MFQQMSLTYRKPVTVTVPTTGLAGALGMRSEAS